MKQKEKPFLRLNMPKLSHLALVPFMAIPAAILVSLLAQLINQIFPFPEHYLENLSQLFSLDLGFWQSFAVIALLPGLCEELLFRGLMPRFFEKYGTKLNIIITALLFAAFHLDPFRFLPVFLLGLLLGYQTLRGNSIFLSMFSHTINNALALFIVSYSGASWLKPFLAGEDSLQYWLAFPAIIILVLAITIFHKITGGTKCAES